ncbi:MAG TPA: flagellar hook-basal body complex protein FliE [Hyphomonadaceae bacterium]|jgi:flagellar hook-basal body complex protein FliE|nr:flagellar hook-basal body complex protein FliE [Hyphomonadaceae bacterium]
MNGVNAIMATGVSSLSGAAAAFPVPTTTAPKTDGPASANTLGSFGDLLTHGLSAANEKVATADKLLRSFALDGSSVPIHEVTIALEEARLAVEMAMQVRTKLVDAYRELMGMQL